MGGILGSFFTGEGATRAGDLSGPLAGFLDGKRRAGGASLLVLGAVLWPVVQNWREEPKDSFPLSYYPMFTTVRGGRTRVTHLIGLDEDGKRHQLHYKYAGMGGMNQVRRQINRAVREGRADALCRTVAERVAAKNDPDLAGVTTVQIVTGRYLLEDYFAGARRPVKEQVRASCPVERGHS